MTLAKMSVAERRYVFAVGVGGPLLAVGMALHGVSGMDAGDWARALLLTLLAAIAYAQPLRVADKFCYDVSEVVHIAMILLFPSWLPGILVALAGSVQILRRPSWRIYEFFNLGQVTTYVTIGALCLAELRRQADLGPSLAGLPPLGAIVATAAIMLLVNMALVAEAIAFQTGARFWRLWRAQVIGVAGTNTALVAVGVVAALVVRDYPLALIPLLVPAGLAQYALSREVKLREDTRAALASLVDVVELRDPYTAGHSQRVAALARALAVRIGLTGAEADMIETAGRVHDLGKVAINPALLVKQGPLDEEEWREIRQHPVHGAAVVAQFAAYRGCAVLVRHHHERWDGGGYPDGLAGEDIPLGARILAVADAFDALTSTRAYRPAHGPDAAMRILESGAGVQWDSRIIEALIEHRRDAEVVPEAAGASQPVPA